jgi:hypothetical protein
VTGRAGMIAPDVLKESLPTVRGIGGHEGPVRVNKSGPPLGRERGDCQVEGQYISLDVGTVSEVVLARRNGRNDDSHSVSRSTIDDMGNVLYAGIDGEQVPYAVVGAQHQEEVQGPQSGKVSLNPQGSVIGRICENPQP